MTPAPSDIAALALAALVGVGLLQCILGWAALHRFRRPRPPSRPPVPTALPPITVLKPLHGDEPLLEQALASNFQQDYPHFQLVFGLHAANDSALAILRRLQARFPHVPVDIVIDRTMHGANRKISNLINMFPRARHDLLVIADSDMHVAPDYLRHLAAAMQPGTGLVTTLYSALPATPTLAAALGTCQVNHAFLPGALMSRALGRQDCLGATMALTRNRLERCGGLEALVDHLADDAVLGRLVLQQGLRVSLAHTIPATTVPETTLAALFAHELRWARTVKSLEPTGFVFGAAQYPLCWAALAIAVTAAAPWACWLFAATWTVRATIAWMSDRALGLASARTVLCLPFRDIMSVAVMLASYRTRRVHWRGQVMIASRPILAPGEG